MKTENLVSLIRLTKKSKAEALCLSLLCEFPLIRLTKKSKGESVAVICAVDHEVSINSTYKEVQSFQVRIAGEEVGTFPLIRLTKKSKGGNTVCVFMHRFGVSINSTYKEVQSFSTCATSHFRTHDVSINSTYKEVQSEFATIVWLTHSILFPLIRLTKKSKVDVVYTTTGETPPSFH